MNQSADNGFTDLLGLGVDFENVSPERRNLMTAPEFPQLSLVDDVPMEDTRETEPTVRQDTSLAGEQVPGRDLDFDNHAQRPIRAPRSRRNNYDAYSRYQQRDSYVPGHAVYHDPDDIRVRAYRYDREYREASPETLQNRAEARFVSAMADVDVRQEREDRRDGGDRYRGGGNKRRRDGKPAMRHAAGSRNTNMHR